MSVIGKWYTDHVMSMYVQSKISNLFDSVVLNISSVSRYTNGAPYLPLTSLTNKSGVHNG